MKIIIFGIGFLGTKLISLLSKENRVIGIDRTPKNNLIKKLDATDKKAVREFLLRERPDVVIDTIALTSSVACEKNPELCKELNYKTARNISDICNEMGTKMIFISSSYVFDGKKGNYKEEDIPSPLNEYGKMKILAEKEILRLNNSIVLRVDMIYGFNGWNEPKGVLNWIFSENEIILREPNQLRQPVLIEDIENTIKVLLEKNQVGIFHVAGLTKISMIDFLKKLESLVRNNSQIRITKEEPEIKIKIPQNATLDISKIKSLGIQTKSLEEGLEILKNQLKN